LYAEIFGSRTDSTSLLMLLLVFYFSFMSGQGYVLQKASAPSFQIGSG